MKKGDVSLHSSKKKLKEFAKSKWNGVQEIRIQSPLLEAFFLF